MYLSGRYKDKEIRELKIEAIQEEKRHSAEKLQLIQKCDSIAAATARLERERERAESKAREEEHNKIMDAALNNMDEFLRSQEASKRRAKQALKTKK